MKTVPIRKNRSQEWVNTDSEKRFIDCIGRWTIPSHRRREEDSKVIKIRLLIEYRNSLLARKVWDGIDPKQILIYVNKKLLSYGVKSFPEDIFDGKIEKTQAVGTTTKEG